MINKLEPKYKDKIPVSENSEKISTDDLKKVKELCDSMLKKTKKILDRRELKNG